LKGAVRAKKGEGQRDDKAGPFSAQKSAGSRRVPPLVGGHQREKISHERKTYEIQASIPER